MTDARRKFTDEQIARAAELRIAGHLMKCVALELGMSGEHVKHLTKHLASLPRGFRRNPPEGHSCPACADSNQPRTAKLARAARFKSDVYLCSELRIHQVGDVCTCESVWVMSRGNSGEAKE